jgi:hypothetical protein
VAQRRQAEAIDLDHEKPGPVCLTDRSAPPRRIHQERQRDCGHEIFPQSAPGLHHRIYGYTPRASDRDARPNPDSRT